MEKFLTLLIVALALYPLPSHAYLDPGSGSVVVQAIVVALAGSAFFIKTNYLRIKIFFQKLFSRTPKEPVNPVHEPEKR